MIPRAYITEWRAEAPWQTDAQVEQDLVISRALVEIYLDPYLKDHLGFRGGTALHKLHLKPPVRYSEDIDFIQLQPGPIGPLFDRLKNRLGFLGEPIRRQKDRNNVLIFRFESEIPPVTPLRLKVEINCREHFAVHGIRKFPYEVKSSWFRGISELSTFTLEELLGSKMRALYQRSRGRDLFDLSYALEEKTVNTKKVIQCFYRFMAVTDAKVSRKEFTENLEQKIKNRSFLADTNDLLRSDIQYDPMAASESVMENLISKLD